MRMVTLANARFCLVAMLLMPVALAGQTNPEISGRVIAVSSGDAVVGATVSVEIEGRVLGTITDADGFFALQVPEDSGTLIVRALGYADSSVAIDPLSGGVQGLQVTLTAAPLRIGGVQVLAPQEESYERLPGTATSLPAVALRQIQALGTQELLESVPGIYGAADDGFGNARLSIGIRGLNPRRSSRILVLEDGIPIQPAVYVYPNMYYNPPVDRIQGVEVIRGSAAIRYGPQTMGGVINYITSRPRLEPGGSVGLTRGANGYASAFAELGGFGSERMRSEIQLLGKRGEGFRQNNEFEQLNGTLKTTIRTGPRSTLFLKANGDYEESGATYTGLTEFSFNSDPSFNPKANDQFSVRRASLDAIYSKVHGPNLSALTRAYFSAFDRRWWRENDVFIRASQLGAYVADPASVSFLAPFDPGDKVRIGNGRDNFGILRTFYAAGVEQAYTWSHGLEGLGAELEIGARLHGERFIDDRVLGDSPTARVGVYTMPDPDDPENDVVAQNPAAKVTAKAQNYETVALALFASERLSLGALEVTPGARFEIFEQERVDRLGGSRLDDRTTAVVLPGLGLNWELGRTNLFGGIHRGFTPPSSGTLNVVSFGSDVEDGGLDVEAEKSWNLEAGLRTSGSLLTTELSGFYIRIEDLVAAGRGTAFRNLGMARTYGVELATSLRAFSSDNSPVAHVSYTYLQTEVLDGRIQSAVVNNVPSVDISGNELPYAPRHNVTLAVTQQIGGASLRADYRYVGDVFTDFENLDYTTGRGDTGPVPAYSVIGGSLQVPIGEALIGQLTVKNALDEIYIGSRLHSNPRQTAANQSSGILPGARRQVNVSLRYSF